MGNAIQYRDLTVLFGDDVNAIDELTRYRFIQKEYFTLDTLDPKVASARVHEIISKMNKGIWEPAPPGTWSTFALIVTKNLLPLHVINDEIRLWLSSGGTEGIDPARVAAYSVTAEGCIDIMDRADTNLLKLDNLERTRRL